MIKSFMRWLNGSKDAEEQYNLGRSYADGQGVEQDYQQAANWFRKAAEQGHADAQLSLGKCYLFARGVTQDYQQAVYWIRKAAEQGHAEAQFSMAMRYQRGQGVEHDDQQVVQWFRKAAEQGHAPSQLNLASCFLYGDGVEQNYQQAAQWYQKVAEQAGYVDAQYELGRLYEYGRGVSQSYKRAEHWYRKAAEQDHSDAQYRLGRLYEYGLGVSPDYEQAAQWYRKAAEQGNTEAQNALRSLSTKSPTPSPEATGKPTQSIEEQILNYLKKQPVNWEYSPKNQDSTLKNFCSSLVFSENVAAVYSDEVIKSLELTIQQKRARNPQIADYNAAMEGNILALLYKYSYLMHIFHAMDAIKFDTVKVDMQKLWLLIQQDCNTRIGNLADEKQKNPAIQTILGKYAYDHQTMRVKVLTDATGREMDYIISSLMANSLVTVISLLFSNPQLLQTIKPYSADDISGMMDAHIATAATMKFSTYSQ